MEHLQYLNRLKKDKDDLESKKKKSLAITMDQLKRLEGLGGHIRSSSKQVINFSINENLTKASQLLAATTIAVVKFNKGLYKIRRVLGEIIASAHLRAGELQNVYAEIEALEKDFLVAEEEFYEAQILFDYLKSGKKKILMPKASSSHFETYAGALADFCGELLRKAKLDVITKSGNEKEIKKYYKDSQYIYQLLANFAFSNKSGIRSKVDKLKAYIGELEKILYDLSLR